MNDNYLKKELYELIKTDESIFDFIQESSLDGLWYRDLENPEEQWMNPKFWTVLGYNPKEMPHKSTAWQNIINQDDLKVANENFTRHCENPDHPYNQIVRYTHKNGSTVWFRCRGMAIRDESGKPIRMLGAHHDITDIKSTEKELIKAKEKAEESEKKYRSYIKYAPDGIFLTNEKGNYIEVNDAACQITGYSEDELLKRSIFDLLFEEDIESGLKHFRNVRENGSASLRSRFTTKDGEMRFWNVSAVKLSDTRFLGFVKDITELKQTEEALQEKEKQSAFLAQTAFELVKLKSVKEIYAYTVHKLYELFEGNAIVALVEFNQRKKRWKMQHAEGVGKKAGELSKLLGFDINQMEGDISTKYYEQISSGNLTAIDFDLPGLFNNKLSVTVNRAVKKMLAVEKIYCISYKQVEQIIGNITIIPNKKSKPINTPLIEAFVQQVSNLLKKQKADEEIRKKDIQFRKLSAHLPDLIYQFTRRPDGSYFVPIASEGIKNIFGCQPEDVKDNFDAIARVLHPDDARRIINDIEYSAKHLTYFTCEFRVLIPGKPVQWILSRSTPEKLPDGSITWYGFNANITEYKQIEKELKESKNLFQQISLISKTGGWNIDMVTGDHNWTGLTREIHEVGQDFVPNMEMATNFYQEGESKEKIIKAVNRCIETGESFDTEAQIITGKGNKRWVRSIGSAEFQNGKCIKLSGTIQDITRGKRAEEALQISENRFKKLSSFTFEGIIIHKNAIATDANQSTLKLLGYEKEEIIGANLFDFIHPDYRAIAKNNVKKQVATPYHIVAVKKDGSTFDAEIEARDVTYNDEHFRVVCVRDISERKRAEKIRQLQYNIARATITKGNLNELFDSVKNELNTIIDAKNFVVAFYNEETGMLHANVNKDEKDKISLWPAEKSLSGFVIRQNRPVLLRKNEILKLYKKGTIELIGTTAEVWLGVPLIIEGKITGVVVVQNYNNPDAYDQASIEIMELVANELSLFIDRYNSKEMVNKLSRAVEQSAVSVMITNREGAIEFVNPFFSELTGYNIEEVKGKTPGILKSGHQPTAFYKELWDTILSGNDWKGEMLNKKKSGKFYWVKAVISPVLNREGAITNFVAIKEDITGRKNAEKELQIKNRISNIFIHTKHEDFYKEVLNAFRDYFGTEYGYFGYINEDGDLVAESMTKDVFNECQIGDKSIVFPRDNWGGLWGDALKRKTTLYQNGNMQFPVGHVQLQNTIAVPLVIKKQVIGQIALANKQGSFNENDKQSINNLCDYLTPLLHSKFKEDKYKNDLLIAKEKAQESDRLKSAFLANMSHEIRTPMNGIIGFTNLLLEPDLNSKEKESYIRIVHQSGQRMLNTVNDIVEISKIEAGLVNVAEKEIDINEKLEELTRFFQLEAEKKGLKLILEMVLPTEKKNILTDPNKLESILTNLIKNAIKYTESGTINLGYREKGTEIEFYVKDTGIGIPPHRQKAVFNRFEQADVEDTRAFEGSGLGLAISKSYVKMLGGEIGLESEEGKGSTFYFTLPAKRNFVGKSNAEKQISFQSEKSKSKIKGLKILIAEDDVTTINYLSLIVNDFSTELLEAKTGNEAIKHCQNNKDIDLVLMDIRMPELDGYEATRRIREFNKEVVIIAQTAHAIPGDREKAIEAGCNDYIAKPVKKEALLEKIQHNLKLTN